MNKYCHVKLGLIIENSYIGKDFSLQVAYILPYYKWLIFHEAYILPLEPKKSLLSVEEEEEDMKRKILL